MTERLAHTFQVQRKVWRSRRRLGRDGPAGAWRSEWVDGVERKHGLLATSNEHQQQRRRDGRRARIDGVSIDRRQRSSSSRRFGIE